jgi:hypothetical protein
MEPTTPIHRPGSLRELAAEGRARIARDQAEFDAELGETPLSAPPDDELARQRAKRDQIRGGA